MPETDSYAADLAYIHDAGFGDFARGAAPYLLKIIGQQQSSSRVVVDLGCGSGILARALADAGYDVVGVDTSAAMIEIARRRVPQAEFHVASYAGFPLPPCRCVTAIGEVFNYSFDRHNSTAALSRVCRAIVESLVPGGMLIFDIAEPGRSAGMKQSFREGPDWTCLVKYQHDERARQLTRHIITFRKIGDMYRRHEETHRLQLFEGRVVADMLNRCGFAVELIQGYGENPFSHGVAGYLARKSSPALPQGWNA